MTTDDALIEKGMEMARAVFKRRGDNSEIHITQADLAALFTIAAFKGYDYRVTLESRELLS